MGYVKLDRSLLDWEWFSNSTAVHAYIFLLMKAEYTDTRYKGIELKRGQAAVTIPQIADQCGISIQQTRTVLEKLKSTGLITVKATSKFSIITLFDYDGDLFDNKKSNSQITDNQHSEQQSNNSPTLLIKENKNIRNQEYALTREDAGFDNSFEKFWSSYPKKIAKQQALKAWEKLNPDEGLIAEILASLEKQKRSVQWTKDNGQYIPYPATWLNGARWEDESEVQTEKYSIGHSMPKTKQDGIQKYQPSESNSSFDQDSVIAQLKARYKNN